MVTEAHLKYHRPARLNDVLDVETFIANHSPVSINFLHDITNQDGVLCVSGDVKAACVNRDGKVKRMPAEILAKLEER